MSCFVDVAAPGLFAWLSQTAPSPQRRLLLYLLAADPQRALALAELAHALDLAPVDAGRLLFALNRQAALRIASAAPRPAARLGLGAALAQALQQVTHAGGAAVLADDAGLLLAQAGCTPQAAARVAAGLGGALGFVAWRSLHVTPQRLQVFVAGPVSPQHPAWVLLARQLQRHAGCPAWP